MKDSNNLRTDVEKPPSILDFLVFKGLQWWRDGFSGGTLPIDVIPEMVVVAHNITRVCSSSPQSGLSLAALHTVICALQQRSGQLDILDQYAYWKVFESAGMNW